MLTRIRRHGPIVVVAILGGLIAARDLNAQDPKTPRPIPVTPTTKPSPIPQPIMKQPGSEKTMIHPEALRRPDLQLTINPRSLSAAPSVFTVENTGPVSAARASLLRVTVRVLPLDGGYQHELPAGRVHLDLGYDGIREALGAEEAGDGLAQSEFADLCAPPFDDFEAAIDALDAGETQAISQSGTSVTGAVRDVGLVAARPATRIPSHSYIREIEVRLVCVYELRATVDANREIQELLERNNKVVHTFQREVTLR